MSISTNNGIKKAIKNPLTSTIGFFVSIISFVGNAITIWDFAGRYTSISNTIISWQALLLLIFIVSLGITLLSFYLRDKDQRKEIVKLKDTRVYLFVYYHKTCALLNMSAQKCLITLENSPEKERLSKMYKAWIDESYELFHILENMVSEFSDDIDQRIDLKSIYDSTVSELRPHVRHSKSL